MKTEIVAFNIDSELKASMNEVCHAMGMDIATAFTIFARKVVCEKRIPFEIVLKEEALKPEPKAPQKQKSPEYQPAESKAESKTEIPSGFTPNQKKKFERAMQGDAKAQNTVASYYETGRGVDRDYDKAMYWYSKAARKGITNAQYHLGIIYDNVKKYPRAAIMWFEVACLSGLAMNAVMLDHIEKLEEQLSPSEIKSAREEAQMKFQRIKQKS